MRALLLSCVLLVASVAFAASEQAGAEIGYLLQYVEQSKARFIRSGKEYSGKEAADHLRQKLSHAGDRVKSAEDFIKGIASSSYLTGAPYRVRLPDGTIRPTGPWLEEALAQRRSRVSKE